MQNDINFQFPELLHSVQYYWRTTGSTLLQAMNRDGIRDNMSEEFQTTLDTAIAAATDCSDFYGEVIRRQHHRDAFDIYQEAEVRFYNLLNPLILNNLFLDNLQTVVRQELLFGSRFFEQFLSAIEVFD
jgi:hypothetical protein